MKVFAIGSINELTQEQKQQHLPSEVPATLKLYLGGQIEQFWFREDRPGVVFLMNVEALDQARAAVNALPLTVAGLMTFEFIQVGPLAPLGLLIQGH
ncbi:superoxide dismutase [Pseudomonas gingeri]